MIETIFPSISGLVLLSGIGLFFGVILSIAKLKLFILKDIRINEILNLLPGTNCGVCGFPGCAQYARRIVDDGVDISHCLVGGESVLESISKVMQVNPTHHIEKRVPKILCRGGRINSEDKFEYSGPLSCLAASQVSGGYKVCNFACLGLGDCVSYCKFGAIYIDKSGLPVVNEEKCSGCGMCFLHCPRNLILMRPRRTVTHIRCRNTEKFSIKKKACSVCCTACRLCEKACMYDAIHIVNFCASIDYKKCTDCGKCFDECPTKVISYKKNISRIDDKF
jgi:Na+-translocating ferredoxin:NAD+ oxidoreductase RNF subunit RnfB